MTFKLSDERVGFQQLTTVDDTAMHTVLSRCRGNSATLGEGEFIYLKGVASTVLGDAVTYDEAGQTTRAVAATRGPIAFAMAATIANTWGWYQIKGIATAIVAAGNTADSIQFLTATAGTLDDAVVAAQRVQGCLAMSAIGTPTATTAYMAIDYPHCDGL